MSSSTQAVFLSYASQDAEAARRICDTLRAAGVVVWFDQNELVGGDVWDAKIRKQIRECAVPHGAPAHGLGRRHRQRRVRPGLKALKDNPLAGFFSERAKQ